MPDTEFVCGIVEGFYNRPWSLDQRVDLFQKLATFGLNAYLYAPKDDCKHRASWRRLYDEKEATDLRTLIDQCNRNDIRFFYGISPGLDIRYSDYNDRQALYDKLQQVGELGCTSFAVLWDDISTCLPLRDRKHFVSLAQAQVQVTNEVFRRLVAVERFLVCPLEYCATRADPNVDESDYLHTLGRELDERIGVFWTGSTVVPEQITKEEMQKLARVLQRKPFIWDNLHANDYDQQRCFLGPYAGRDTTIMSSVSGVMLNPNCEYSLNIPALYSLGNWSCSYDLDSWNPVSDSRAAISHFLEETRRPTQISNVMMTERNDEAENSLTQEDIELLFDIFWLPHSHGPKGSSLINDFKYLLDTAHLIMLTKMDEDVDGDEDTEFILSWAEKASAFGRTCKQFSRLCDNFALIENRQLFFDLNPYLNNVQVMLSTCNRYLKWVSIERCEEPIKGGPTLAGLPGGFAGDLQRLFPVRSNVEYPLLPSFGKASQADKSRFQLSPVRKEDFETMADCLPRLHCEASSTLFKCDDESDLPSTVRQFLTRTRCRVFLDQIGARGVAIYDGKILAACLVGSSNVKQVVQELKDAFDDFKHKSESHLALKKWSNLPVKGSAEIPWSLLAADKCDAIISLTSIPSLLFSRQLENAIELLLMSLLDWQTTSIIVDQSSFIMRKFLCSVNFHEIYVGEQFVIMSLSKAEEK